ncbi:hypothetical protein BC477_16025 [Clavibacter michiganensis subsp. michiganensis]|uniref:DUF3515 domain-containing protein n=1 Tax=Clavibacter michiganensis subsp. michiganensis TaxID=33013 RepID=A0A251XFS6_CLAMM|nr:hypothetical protein BC477_16025 [Clavibacter michiganensis subsp. michiganensis]OUE01315.1 hypothetical protein CMMCAS07_13480 [Clavibacter michiganensis subsp. michiganensis]
MRHRPRRRRLRPTVSLEAAPDATDPLCADVVVHLPATLGTAPLRETDAQGTGAWGDPQSTVILRCGVATPGPTTDACISYDDVDWVEDDSRSPTSATRPTAARPPSRSSSTRRRPATPRSPTSAASSRSSRRPPSASARRISGRAASGELTGSDPGGTDPAPTDRARPGATARRAPRSRITCRPVRHQRSHGSSCGQCTVSEVMPRLIRSGRVDGRVSGRMLMPIPRCGSSTMRCSGRGARTGRCRRAGASPRGARRRALEPGVPAEREVGSEQRRVPERERDRHEVRAEVGDSRDAAERAGSVEEARRPRDGRDVGRAASTSPSRSIQSAGGTQSASRRAMTS